MKVLTNKKQRNILSRIAAVQKVVTRDCKSVTGMETATLLLAGLADDIGGIRGVSYVQGLAFEEEEEEKDG